MNGLLVNTKSSHACTKNVSPFTARRHLRLFYFNRLGPRVYRVDRLYFNLYALELGFTL